jgi:drug/metabolite transporter (DMT)-like permease
MALQESPMNPTPAPRHAGIYVRLALVALIWGGTFIAGRVAAAEIAPATAALWRYVVAAVALLVTQFALDGGLPRLSGRQWLGVTLLGATGVAAYNLCFMFGLQTVPASRAALIVALNPAGTFVGAALLFGEPVDRRKVLGVAVALLGAAVVIGHGDPLALLRGGVGGGDVVIFGCVVSWVAYTLIGKRILAGLSPLAATTYAALTGTAILAVTAGALPAPLGGIAPPAASLAAWAAIAFLGVFGTAIAFVWFYEGIRAIGPARAAVFINLVPVAAVALGALLLGERLEASMLAGGALVVAGVWLLNRPAGRGPGAAEPVPPAIRSA